MGQPANLVWRTSAASGGYECVAVALFGDKVLVRRSMDSAGPVLEFTSGEWRAFLIGARDGEFDVEAP